MTKPGKLVVIAGITIGLTVVGILVRDGRVLALALPCLLYTGVFLFLGADADRPDLAIERILNSARMKEGETFHVTLTVENRGEPIPTLSLAEQLPPEIAVIDGETTYLSSLGAGERIVLHYTLRAPRGEHTLPGLYATTWKKLTLTPQAVFLPYESPFLILPRVEILEDIEIRPRLTRAYAGVVRANRGGSGLDFFGCHAYSPGDDIRRINWRAYAKQGELIINEYEQERIADVNVLLDARVRANSRIGSEETFTHAVRAAASLASYFLKQGNNVGLLIYGDYLNWTYPGYGKVQRERILDALARAETSDKEVFEDLRHVPTRLFPPRSQLIVVSPLVGEEDVEILGLLRVRGYQIILITPNLLALELKEVSPSENRDLAVRILKLKRRLLLNTLVRIGVEVVDWNVTEPLSYPISWGLSRRGRRLG